MFDFLYVVLGVGGGLLLGSVLGALLGTFLRGGLAAAAWFLAVATGAAFVAGFALWALSRNGGGLRGFGVFTLLALASPVAAGMLGNRLVRRAEARRAARERTGSPP